MARVHELLAEYAESHQHPLNKQLHWVCVPLIVWSLLCLLWSIKSPAFFADLPITFNWAVIAVVLSMVYYLWVSGILAIGNMLVFILMLISIYWLDMSSVTVWKPAVVIFIVAWIGQFIGHSIEGKRPSFFKDIQFLLIGPLWLLSFVYRKLNIEF